MFIKARRKPNVDSFIEEKQEDQLNENTEH